jgi:hypothetical protein
VHFREILPGYFLFSRFDWSIFVTQLVAKHMKEIIILKFVKRTSSFTISVISYLFSYQFYNDTFILITDLTLCGRFRSKTYPS